MIYDFIDEHGNSVSLSMSLAQYEAAKSGGDTIRHDGRTLTRIYTARGANATTFKPCDSEAMAGHPDQRDEMIAEAKRRGVPVEFTADARPFFTSRQQKREYMKAFGYEDKNAFN